MGAFDEVLLRRLLVRLGLVEDAPLHVNFDRHMIRSLISARAVKACRDEPKPGETS